MKKILITGAGSYIGEKVKDYLLQEQDKYFVEIVDTMGWIQSRQISKALMLFLMLPV